MFKKFKILNHNEAHQTEEQVEMIINLNHVVSVKPIKMTNSKREVIDGFWVRLSNSKKYKAISIPKCLEEAFEQDLAAPKINNFEADFQIQ